MPASLQVGFLANITLFYLGMAYVETPARRYGFLLLCGIFALGCGLLFLNGFRQDRLPWWRYGLMALWLAFFVGNILESYLQRPDAPYMSSTFGQFVVLCIPAFLAGVIGAQRKRGEKLFESLEKMSVFVFPAGLIYCVGALFDCAGFGDRWLGVIGYMYMAFGVAPFMLSHMVRFQDREPLTLAGHSVRRVQLLRILFLAE